MDWGMENRLSNIIRPDTGRTVMLALDHGYFLGPVSKLEDPSQTISPLIPYADALMVTRGVLRHCINPGDSVSVVLRVSGGNSIVGKDLSNEEITVDIEDAIRLNVQAVAFSIYIGAEYEHQTLVCLARLVDIAQRYGIPVLGVTAVGKELKKRDARYLSLCCRIAAEFGVNFIKTYYCENFAKVVNSCPVPLIIAGGPKMNSEKDVFSVAYRAIQEGAVGVDMGRNVWQSANPVGMIKALRHIVHQNGSVASALELARK